MTRHVLSALLSGGVLVLACAPAPAGAANPMDYRLLTQEDAASLPHNHGALGLNIERAEQITDDGLTFDLIRVKQARRGSAGAQAGFKPGDEIIAIDGRVFASLVAFGAYIGSLPPGSRMQVDTIPAGGGPQQAQRVAVTVGEAGRATAPAQGLSTRTKVAIGVGAVAVFGCYELGCFSHRQQHTTPQPATPQSR